MNDDRKLPSVVIDFAGATVHRRMETVGLAQSPRDSQRPGTLESAGTPEESNGKEVKKLTRTYLLIEVEHSKDIPEMTDLFANRISTHSHVEAVTSTLLDSKTAYWMAYAQKEGI